MHAMRNSPVARDVVNHSMPNTVNRNWDRILQAVRAGKRASDRNS